MTNTRLSDCLVKMGIPVDVGQHQKIPFEQTPEYRDMLMREARAKLRKAGLRGTYMQADSSEGHQAFERFKQGSGTYFFGLPGRGKTYAAACCVRLALSAGYKAKLTTAKALLDAIKAEWDGGEKGTLQRAERYNLLVLDDLGMERPTEWAMETITGLIDVRTSDQLPTIITSNYSLGDLRERWGGMQGARLASRIAGSCIRVEMRGIDRRSA